MTTLRPSAPLFAPRVSSRAVGIRERPEPKRPPVARISSGSSLQRTWPELPLPRRVLPSAAEARLNKPRGRSGSTYLSRGGVELGIAKRMLSTLAQSGADLRPQHQIEWGHATTPTPEKAD